MPTAAVTFEISSALTMIDTCGAAAAAIVAGWLIANKSEAPTAPAQCLFIVTLVGGIIVLSRLASEPAFNAALVGIPFGFFVNFLNFNKTKRADHD